MSYTSEMLCEVCPKRIFLCDGESMLLFDITSRCR